MEKRNCRFSGLGASAGHVLAAVGGGAPWSSGSCSSSVGVSFMTSKSGNRYGRSRFRNSNGYIKVTSRIHTVSRALKQALYDPSAFIQLILHEAPNLAAAEITLGSCIAPVFILFR